MNKIKKISIIVLTYNNWKYLKTSIGSIADQNLIDLEFEIIVSDDGTKDFDKEFVENILKENNLFDKTKIVINKKNIGTVKSFNNAIKLSTGDVIIPLSSDDYFYDSKVINDIVTFFNKNNNALILTGLQIPFDNQKEYQPIISKDKYPLFKSSKSLIRYITLRNNIISGASTYYRKSIFDKYGLFDEGYKLLEDYPFYIKLLSNNCPIYLLNRKVIKYKLGGISTAKKINPILDADLRKARKFAISVADINSLQKRRIMFKRAFTEQERKNNIFNFPEQALLFYLGYWFKKLKNRKK